MAMDIPKLYKEYLSSQGKDQLDARRRDVHEADVRTRVKLEVVETEWTEKSPLAEQEVCSIVDYTQKNATGSKTVAHYRPIDKIQHSAKVILEKGIVRGLNVTFKLPLDKNNEGLIKAFGSHLSVDPSKPESVPQLIMTNFESGIHGDLGPNGATVTVCDRQKEYTGHFVCTVIMKGKCLANGGEQQIGDVICWLQSAQPKNEDLKALSVTVRPGKKGSRKVVQFVIEGDLEYKWDFHERVELKKNP